MISNSTIAVWFSCGAASAVAAKKTIELYGESNVIRVVNNPIAEEHSDNLRFLKDVERWLGVEIEIATNPKYTNASCVEVWDTKKFMSSPFGAPCTLELKKRARQHWELVNKPDHTVLGFTVDEKHRHERFVQTEREILPVLIDLGLTKEDCFRIVENAGIKLPEIYNLGFMNANCIGCVKSSGVWYWNHVRKTFPDVFEQRAKQSRNIGARLVTYKGNRIFLDELPEAAIGRKPKDMGVECGIFCEEKEK